MENTALWNKEDLKRMTEHTKNICEHLRQQRIKYGWKYVETDFINKTGIWYPPKGR